MFEVGDYIIYGSNGVCKITNIGPMKMPGMTSTKLYYTMVPCYIKGSEIFTPVDNERVVMRPVMTKKEAEKFVKGIGKIKPITIIEDKRRELEYKAAVYSCDPETLVGLIKTIYIRMEERLEEGKKVTSSDSKYFKMSEESLYGELAISLDMEKDEVKDYIKTKITETATN